MEEESTERISKPVLYRELCNESRRYRDYELNSSKWYSPMLLAILGYILKDKMFVSNQLHLQCSLTYNFWFTVIILSITFLIVVASVHGVIFAHGRLKETQNKIKELAPELNEYNLSPKVISTRHFIISIPIILGVVIFFVMLFLN